MGAKLQPEKRLHAHPPTHTHRDWKREAPILCSKSLASLLSQTHTTHSGRQNAAPPRPIFFYSGISLATQRKWVLFLCSTENSISRSKTEFNSCACVGPVHVNGRSLVELTAATLFSSQRHLRPAWVSCSDPICSSISAKAASSQGEFCFLITITGTHLWILIFMLSESYATSFVFAFG